MEPRSVLRFFFYALLVYVLLPASAAPGDDIAARLAKWKNVEMPFQSAGMPSRQRQMIEKLVEATRLLDDIYWRQSDIAGLELYKSTQNLQLKRLLTIMGSRWDLVDEQHPFAGAPPMPPGHELYPKGWTRARMESYVKDHPSEKAAIYD